MPEILTESFCERCGTRYTFQAAAPTRSRLSRLKVIARGLRNYVLSDDTTLEEAFADARSAEEREISAQQLEAFHRTFNFCLSCRQYTCRNCWNEAEGRCLTCAPDLSREPLPAPFPNLATAVEPIRPLAEHGRDGGGAGWPIRDLELEAGLGAPSPEASPAPPPPIPAEAPTLAPTVPEPGPGAAPPASPADRAAAAAAQTSALLARFRPEPTPEASLPAVPQPLSADREPETPAARPAVSDLAPAPPVAPVEPSRPAAAEPVAEVPAPAEPVAEAPAPAAVAAAPAPTDRVVQPVWPPAPRPAPPTAPTWLPPNLAARSAGHALGADAVWAESSRDLLAPRSGGVQACVACGLPLSATARFCRRCGSPQDRG
jgi:hypothetical protein